MRNKKEKTTTSFLMLKNSNGEDIYAIDKFYDGIDTNLLISLQKPLIDIFDTLTLYHENIGDICDINLREIIINALADSIDRKICSQESYDREIRMRENFNIPYTEFDEKRIVIDKDTNIDDILHSISGSEILFRDVNECFSNINVEHGEYIPPIADEVEENRDGGLLYVIGKDYSSENI